MKLESTATPHVICSDINRRHDVDDKWMCLISNFIWNSFCHSFIPSDQSVSYKVWMRIKKTRFFLPCLTAPWGYTYRKSRTKRFMHKNTKKNRTSYESEKGAVFAEPSQTSRNCGPTYIFWIWYFWMKMPAPNKPMSRNWLSISIFPLLCASWLPHSELDPFKFRNWCEVMDFIDDSEYPFSAKDDAYFLLFGFLISIFFD